MLMFAASCDWQEPLPSIYENRTGTYVDSTGDFTVIIAETILTNIMPYEYTYKEDDGNTYELTKATNTVTLFGDVDMRLDILLTTSLKITFPVDNYNKLYVYTNYSSDTSNNTICFKE